MSTVEYTPVLDNEDIEDIEVIYDGIDNFTSKGSTRKRMAVLAIKLLFCGCMILVTCAISIALITGVIVYHQQSESEILNTSEYQIDLPHSDAWLDREEEMAVWMQTFEEQCKYFDLSQSEVSTATRLQYYYDIKGKSRCHSDAEIRVRDYLDESHTTIDAKGNSEEMEKAYELPYRPADDFLGNSTQKCERDVHDDLSEKYSRETRVSLPFEYALDNIKTCSDIITLFPDIDITEKYASNEISTKNYMYWFVREYSGYLDKDTMYKIAFTLSYSSINALDTGSSKPSGGSEWSIRIYTLNDGKSDNYNEKVVPEVENAWEYLLETVGSK